MEDVGGAAPLGVAVGIASAVVLALGVGFLVYRNSSPPSGGGGAASGAPGKSTTLPLGATKKASAHISMDGSKPRVRVLYGTQTGTAERFSKQLAGDLRKKYGAECSVEVVDLENYSGPGERLQREQLVILCVATYGDGEPTDNAADFFSWLSKEVEAVEAGEKQPTLSGVTYAVFGLGNKQYEHFNLIGKKAFSGLGVLGAQPLLRRGDGDDDGCIDDDFDKWTAELQAALETRPDLVGKAAVVPEGAQAVPEELHGYTVEELAADQAEDAPFPLKGTGKDHHSPYWATITCARELHNSAVSGRSCAHVEIDISGAQVGYEAGDHVAVHAANSNAVVEEVARLLGLQLSQVVRLSVGDKAKQRGVQQPPAGNLTVRSLLAWHADLLASPHKDALLALSACASDPAQAARLAHLASPAGKQDYADWIARPHRSLLEVLREFPSAKPSLGVFLALVAPRLQPRFYSISSSPKLHPSSVHVTCAVVRDVMPTGRVHEGVASTWLAKHMAGGALTNGASPTVSANGVTANGKHHVPGDLAGGNKVPVFLRSSHFRLPRDPSKPVVMVGPGTGLAPFRGFLQDRAAVLDKGGAAAGLLGPAVLFFGCRQRAGDYIYEEELASYLKQGALTTLHVAFSRDGASKDYVQHHIEREAAEVWRLLDAEGGYLYVCGDAKNMAKDVHRALVNLVASCKGCSGTQAEAWVKQLQDSGRYQRDVW